VNATPLVNAWIFLNEDQPDGTNYNSSNSSYQRLIQRTIYQSVDILNICFVTILPTSPKTVPPGDGSSYTLSTGDPPPQHPGGLTNQDYMLFTIRDSHRINPGIKCTVTLQYGDPNLLAQIFSNPKYPPPENAARFAANVMTYLKTYKLDGFDIDWEGPLAGGTNQQQYAMVVNAIRDQFKRQTNQHYFLTISPNTTENIDPAATNNSIDFINFQLYADPTLPSQYAQMGVNPGLFAYGALFETGFGQKTAEQAYQDNQANYHFNVYTCWRLNSGNFVFEQTQQQLLFQLVNPKRAVG
jgi:glycosyl hydrolase family 18 (putative chitinase)